MMNAGPKPKTGSLEARKYIESRRQQILNATDSIVKPPMKGAGVVFTYQDQSLVLRKSTHPQGVTVAITMQDKESDKVMKNYSNEMLSRLMGLGLGGLGLACGFVALSGPLAPLALVGVAAGTLSTSLSLASVIDLAYDPTGNTNAYESEDWYKWTSMALDGIGLGTAGLAAMPKTAATLAKMSSKGGRQFLKQGSDHTAMLKHMKKQASPEEWKEFKAALQRDMKEMAKAKGVSNKKIQTQFRNEYMTASFRNQYHQKLNTILSGVVGVVASGMSGVTREVVIYVLFPKG